MNQPLASKNQVASPLTPPASGIVIPSFQAKCVAPIADLQRHWEANHKVLLDLLTTAKIGTLDRLILSSIGPSALENGTKPEAGKFDVVRVHDSTRSEHALIHVYKMAWHVSVRAMQHPDAPNLSKMRQAVLVFEAPNNDQGYQPRARLSTRTWTPIPHHKDSIREHLTPSGVALANAYAGAWEGRLELSKEAFSECYRGAAGLQVVYPPSLENTWDVRIRAEVLNRLRAQEVAFECIKLLGIDGVGSKTSTKAA